MRILIVLLAGLAWTQAQALEVSKPEFSFTTPDGWAELDLGPFSIESDTAVYLTKEDSETGLDYAAIFLLVHHAPSADPESLITTGEEIPGLDYHGVKTLGGYDFRTYTYASSTEDSIGPADNGGYFLHLGGNYMFTVTVTGGASEGLAAAVADIEETLKTLELSVVQAAIRHSRLRRIPSRSAHAEGFDLLGRRHSPQAIPKFSAIPWMDGGP